MVGGQDFNPDISDSGIDQILATPRNAGIRLVSIDYFGPNHTDPDRGKRVPWGPLVPASLVSQCLHGPILSARIGITSDQLHPAPIAEPPEPQPVPSSATCNALVDV